jgi:hypothetical protein
MRKDRIITAFLLLLLTVIISSSVTRLNIIGQQTPAGAPTGDKEQSLRKKLSAVKTKQDWDDLLDKLPTADYDAPESGDPVIRDKRRVKNSHYDKRGLVVRNPDTSITLTEVLYEGREVWPLPAGESDVVVVGDVRDRQTYLSNDKSGVYTEFTISVSEVIKGDPARVTQGGTITASRVGGVVRYSNGHKRLYLVVGEGLPLDGGQYVLFLKGDEQGQTYTVLTMYQLGPDGVTPIDEGIQFEPYRGQEKSEFLKTIRDKITKSAQLTPGKEWCREKATYWPVAPQLRPRVCLFSSLGISRGGCNC